MSTLIRKALLLFAVIPILAFSQATPSTSRMITDKTGAIVPQYWDGTQFIATSTTNPLPITTTPAASTDADRSGTITVGGTAQVVLLANPNRKGWALQNTDETNLEELRFSLTGTASLTIQGSYVLAAASGAGFPGGYAQGTGTGAISIIAATTGHKYTLTEW